MARQSENVGSDFLYQAAPSTDSFPVFAASSAAHRVTSENSPNKQRRGSVDCQIRPLALGLEPEMAPGLFEGHLTAHRIAYQVRICRR